MTLVIFNFTRKSQKTMKNSTLLKQTITLSFVGATVLFSPIATQALTVEEVTNPRQDNHGWVTDMADILSDRTETKLNSLINNLEQNNGAEIAVVTVPETAPADSPKAFATELFNYWGIGKAELDNGVLFLVSMGDKRVEIETGEGIESTLSDTEVAQIIDTKITPQYKHKNFDRGTIDGTKALISSLQPSAQIQTSSFAITLLIIFFLWFFFSVASSISNDSKTGKTSKTSNGKKRQRNNSNNQDYYTGYDSSCSSDSGSFFSSGSSSSGGSDFGGGSSDGGGCGGDF